jgi:hypothetical protein
MKTELSPSKRGIPPLERFRESGRSRAAAERRQGGSLIIRTRKKALAPA